MEYSHRDCPSNGEHVMPSINSPTPDATTGTKGKVQLAGDLAGTAAAPTVAKVNGISITGTPSVGQIPTATSTSAATWQTPSGGGSGDVTGPASATADGLATFNSTSGKIIKSATTITASGTTLSNVTTLSGQTVPTSPIMGTTDTQSVTNKSMSGAANTFTAIPLTTAVTGTLPVANGGTGTTSSTGSGAVVLSTSPSFVTPALGTPSALVLTNATGLTNGGLGTGMVAQVASTNFSAVTTGTAILPFDDTIPQITEGFEIMTQSITPKSTTNVLTIEATISCGSSVPASMTAALFQDSTANALAAASTYMATATGPINIKISHTMTAGTTSATTFRIRLGTDAAGTTTFNGVGGVRRFGGITTSNIRIIEQKA